MRPSFVPVTRVALASPAHALHRYRDARARDDDVDDRARASGDASACVVINVFVPGTGGGHGQARSAASGTLDERRVPRRALRPGFRGRAERVERNAARETGEERGAGAGRAEGARAREERTDASWRDGASWDTAREAWRRWTPRRARREASRG